MKFETENIGGVLIIHTPEMDLDAGNAEEFKRDIADILDEQKKVAMDLSGIGFMDSAGMGAILSAFKKVRANGGRFEVFALSPEVNALFDLVRMRRLLDVYPDRESAVGALGE